MGKPPVNMDPPARSTSAYDYLQNTPKPESHDNGGSGFLLWGVWFLLVASTNLLPGLLQAQQGRDFGDLPDTYSTTIRAEGASHLIHPGFNLGWMIDAEADGQPAQTGEPAVGDDLDLEGDDEDGVQFPDTLLPCTTTQLIVHLTDTTSFRAFLDAWIDFNSNGVFDVDNERFTDPTEHGEAPIELSPGDNVVPVNVPCDVVPGRTYARFRLSTTGGIRPDRAGGEGEVEDYEVTIGGEIVYGAIEGNVWCENPDQPNETYNSIDGDVGLEGVSVQFYTDPNCRNGYQDDGLLLNTFPTGRDGRYGIAGLQASHPNGDPFCYVLKMNPEDERLQSCRFPISDLENPVELSPETPVQSAAHFIWVETGIDYSDAPAAYETACHVYDPLGPVLGMGTSIELRPRSASCDEDDGVRMPLQIQPNETTCIEVNAPNGGMLDAWIDYNGDNRFDPDEHLFGGVSDSLSVSLLPQQRCFTTPAYIVKRETQVRFRISTGGNLPPGESECSMVGEVEDYTVRGPYGVEWGDVRVLDAKEGHVLIQWSTISETDNTGFEVMHRPLKQPPGLQTGIRRGMVVEDESVGLVNAAGFSRDTTRYRYEVRDMEPGYHQFWIRQYDLDGTYTHSPTRGLNLPEYDQLKIEPAYPNPFNPRTVVRFEVKESQVVTVQLFDVQGRKIRTLYTGTVPARTTQPIQIDGSDLPSGTYFVRIEGNGLSQTVPMLLLK